MNDERALLEIDKSTIELMRDLNAKVDKVHELCDLAHQRIELLEEELAEVKGDT